MREKVCRRKADRKSEKSDMAESFCCCLPLSPSPSRLSLQMEVNVKQSLLLVSGGINSLEWDSAVREVNTCLSAQLFPCSNTLYFSKMLLLHSNTTSFITWTVFGYLQVVDWLLAVVSAHLNTLLVFTRPLHTPPVLDP